MPVRYIYHEQARNALINDGWRITHDSQMLKYKGALVFIDLGRRSDGGTSRESSGLPSKSRSWAVHSLAILKRPSDNIGCTGLCWLGRRCHASCFLAVPQQAYESLQEVPALIEFIAEEQINLLVFDVEKEEIVQWIK